MKHGRQNCNRNDGHMGVHYIFLPTSVFIWNFYNKSVLFFFKDSDHQDRSNWQKRLNYSLFKKKNQSCKGACSLLQFLPLPLILQPALLPHLRGPFGSGSIWLCRFVWPLDNEPLNWPHFSMSKQVKYSFW